ncbi:hypothetical protein EMIT0P4_160106 [Pseudomonas sp. IT-P4]
MRLAKLLDGLLARYLNISLKMVVDLARVAHSKKNLMKPSISVPSTSPTTSLALNRKAGGRCPRIRRTRCFI